jgi:hypothetical protein
MFISPKKKTCDVSLQTILLWTLDDYRLSFMFIWQLQVCKHHELPILDRAELDILIHLYLLLVTVSEWANGM